jgi:hypothetical protein
MAGVPHHAAKRYIARLIEAGQKVAICEQLQDPKDAKGVVERAVVRVVTPGTLTEDNLLDGKRSNHLAEVIGERSAERDHLHREPLDLHFDRIDLLVAGDDRLGPFEVMVFERGHRADNRMFGKPAHLRDQPAQLPDIFVKRLHRMVNQLSSRSAQISHNGR